MPVSHLKFSLRFLFALVAFVAVTLVLSLSLDSLWFVAAIPCLAMGILLAIDPRSFAGIVIGAIASIFLLNLIFYTFLYVSTDDFLNDFSFQSFISQVAGIGTSGGTVGGTVHAARLGHRYCWWLLLVPAFFFLFIFNIHP